jgi:hypothetical protein
MDPLDPRDAQRIVGAYLEVVEAHATDEVYPGTLRDLPYSKDTIRTAFRTATVTLFATEQLTPDLREYLEIGYMSLADYVEEEFAALLREYVRAGQELAADGRMAREKAATDTWRRVSEQSRLAGEIARSISVEGERLRAEFQSWQSETATSRVPQA